MSENANDLSIIEALILASPEPISGRKVAEVIDEMTVSRVAKAVAGLNNRYMEAGASFRIRELAGGYQFYITPEYSGFVNELFLRRRKMRLTRAALETLAIVAYKQPVTKTEIEHIRGVASDGVLQNLLEKSMVVIRGRAETVGKPLQYGTSDEFLKFFGLNSLDDLPQMSEIEELVGSAMVSADDEIELESPVTTEEIVRLNLADTETGSENGDSDEIAPGNGNGEHITIETESTRSNE